MNYSLKGNLGYQFLKRGKYQYYTSVNYVRNFEYPSIDQLYTIVDDINAYEIRIGNPQLKNSTNHTVNTYANFNTQDPKSIYSINSNISGGYTLIIDPVTDSIINEFSGKRTSYYVNGDNRKNLNFNYSFNISRKLKKNNLQLMYNGQISSGKNPNYIDGISNTSETGSLYNQFTMQFSLGSVFIFNIGQTLQYFKSTPTSPRLTSFKNSSKTSRAGIVLNYPKNLTFSSTVDYLTNSNLNKPTNLWNAFTSYRFMKQQGELKFSAMDLLKQYQNISNSVNSFGTTTRITNGLQQYFLVTFSYYPRKFGKTEMKRKAD